MEKISNQNMKIDRTPLSDQVYNTIKEFIVSDKWKVGEKIPSEKDLAEMFGVNRLTVRIALQKLNTLGIVETRVGEGTFVLSFNFRKYINEVAEFTMQPEQESDIRDFRKLIEIECARLAIERGTEKELIVLKKLSDKCKQIGYKLNDSYSDRSLEKDIYIEFANADLNFHYHICKMSHNSLYINCFNLASQSIFQYILMILEENYKNWISDGGHIANYFPVTTDHEAIYNFIRGKDFENCRKNYLHMIDYNEML